MHGYRTSPLLNIVNIKIERKMEKKITELVTLSDSDIRDAIIDYLVKRHGYSNLILQPSMIAFEYNTDLIATLSIKKP